MVPETHRRVRLCKHGSDRPLGFFIRDGTSVRITPHGVEKVPGIFISRLVPGGLAESTGRPFYQLSLVSTFKINVRK